MTNVPTIETVHIDAAMTQVSVAYRNNKFVAEQIFPRVPVLKKSDKYFIHDKEQFRDDIDDLRRPGDSPREIRWSLSNDNYSCEGHARTGVLPDEIRDNSDPAIRAEVRTTELTTQKILLRQEINFRAILQDFTTVFVVADGNRSDVGAGAAKWFDAAFTSTVDPVQEVALRKVDVAKKSGEVPNTILMSREVAEKVKQNAVLINRFKFTAGGAEGAVGPLITDASLKSIFQIDNMIISDALLNTGAFGLSTLDYVLGKHIWLLVVTPTPGLDVVSFAYTFIWTATGGADGMLTERERAPGGRRSTLFHVHKYYDFKTIDRLAGYVWKDAVT